jgi:hypothetical protein
MAAYVSFQGDVLDLAAWRGEHVAYLTPGGGGEDPGAMRFVLEGTDAAYEWYRSVTGREPSAWAPTMLDGLATVAVVPATCGAACGYLGFTGIEILEPFWADLHGRAEQGVFDQIPLYELGRNFWFYGEQLGAIDGFTTGFAIANRFLSGEAVELEVGGRLAGLEYAAARQFLMVELLDLYLEDPAASWRMLDDPDGLITVQGRVVGAADLAGAFFHHLHEEAGPEDYAAFWQAMGVLPAASTEEEARDNFLAAALGATGDDYGFLFKEAGTVAEAPGKGRERSEAGEDAGRHEDPAGDGGLGTVAADSGAGDEQGPGAELASLAAAEDPWSVEAGLAMGMNQGCGCVRDALFGLD